MTDLDLVLDFEDGVERGAMIRQVQADLARLDQVTSAEVVDQSEDPERDVVGTLGDVTAILTTGAATVAALTLVLNELRALARSWQGLREVFVRDKNGQPVRLDAVKPQDLVDA